MTDVMIDIETLGGAPRAMIMSIGAVKFEIEALEPYDTFYTNVTLDGQMREIHADTVRWWLQQSGAARESLFVGLELGLKESLYELAGFVKGADRVWANGTTFDLVILSDAYKQLSIPVPWSYSQEMCLRPIRFFGEVLGLSYSSFKADYLGTLHNALDDARLQTIYLLSVLRAVRPGESVGLANG
ncbi:hypothetical protein LCGC14_2049070 [marine sediment metagenome]|uniref:3'-5' exoribonuclease Rv2179c-like domain-containing protein n=1 Tax=marine sediment metagenome TaxID=412755 RepID=A0A0F9FC32_9ZZZZ